MTEGPLPISEFAPELERRGVTDIVINRGEFNRLGRDYPVAPWTTQRGEGRWWAFVRTLGTPVNDTDGVVTYRVAGGTP